MEALVPCSCLQIFYFSLHSHCTTNTQCSPCVFRADLYETKPPCHCNRMAKSDIQGNSRPEQHHCPLDHPEECEHFSKAQRHLWYPVELVPWMTLCPGATMWSWWGQLVQLRITSQWCVMPLALRGSCPQHRGSAGQLRKFRLCQFPMTLQPVPKHRSCDFPQAVLKSQLVISSCRANCRWFLLKII